MAAPATGATPTALARSARRSGLPGEIVAGHYRLRLASTGDERAAIFRLRFEVFNLELNEGLASAYRTGYDTDQYDSQFDHLLVENSMTGTVVGTYRLQTGEMAANARGFYSSELFDMSPYLPLRPEMLELGRACVHRDHRLPEVLQLLWKGIALYAVENGAHYVIGCSSLTTQDPALGSAMYHKLKGYLVEERLRTVPLPEHRIAIVDPPATLPSPPKLLRTYLVVGAQICGEPAIDRDFGTIDFLTLIDLDRLTPAMRSRVFGLES